MNSLIYPWSADRRVRALACALSLLACACGGGGGGDAAPPPLVAPAGLSFPTNPIVYGIGLPAPANAPLLQGDALGFSISPPLPAGLSLDPESGIISGTPLEVSPLAIFTFSATNELGVTSASLALGVAAPPAPQGLSYPASPAFLTQGEAANDLAPSFSGVASGFLITAGSDALPDGLSFDSSTGRFTGTPAAASEARAFGVNAFGFSIPQSPASEEPSDTGFLVLSVLAPGETPLLAFSYSQDPLELEVGQSVQVLPELAGAAFALDPASDALPDGLALNPVSGALEGTLTQAQELALLDVRATPLTGGERRALLTVIVRDPRAPGELSYAVNPARYSVGVPALPNLPSVEGEGLSFSSDPALPAGLALDPATGAIAGTPTLLSDDALYTLSASNAQGSASTVLLLGVEEPRPPANLSYSESAPSYSVGVAITPNTPSLTGAAGSWSADPALPSGLVLDASTGLLSGTPGEVANPTDHQITASGPAGSATTTLNISVVVEAPSGLLYPENPAVYTRDVAIASNLPSVTGPVNTFAITPALPSGLIFDTLTGELSGTPSVAAAQTDHAVTATNAAGSTTALLRVTVIDPVPPTAAFSADPTAGTAPLAVSFTNESMGAVTSSDWDFGDGAGSAEANPVHTYLDPGVFSVTLTVTGPFGSDALTLTDLISVSSGSGGALANLSYPDPTPSFAVDVEIATQLPSFEGTVDSFALAASSAPLPAGLSLNAFTGALEGVPQLTTAAPAAVVVEASNSLGESATASLDISVGLGAGRALFVANNVSGTVSIYSYDDASGLTRGRGHVFAPSPFALAATPDRGHLLVANNTADSLSVFQVDVLDGDLTEVSGSPFGLSGAGPHILQDVAVDTSGRFVYAAAQTSGLVFGFALDPGSGALSELAGSPFGPFLGARSLDATRLEGGDFLFLVARDEPSSPVRALRVESDGALTEVSALGAGSGANALALDRAGPFLYVANNLSGTVSGYAVATDGSLSELAASPFSSPVGALGPRQLEATRSASGARTLYVVHDNAEVAQYSIGADGALTSLAQPSATAEAAAGAIAAAPGGSHVYVANFGATSLSAFAASTTGGSEGELGPLLGLPGVRTHLGPSDVLLLPDEVAPSFDSINLYAANFDSDDVNQFAISEVDGTLDPLSVPTVAGGNGPNWIELHPKSDFAYMVNASDALQTLSAYSIGADGGLGALQVVAQESGAWSGHVNPNGSFLYLVLIVSKKVLTYPIQPDGSLGAALANFGTTGEVPRAGAVDPTGRNFYVPNGVSGSISQFAIDLPTGELSALSPTAVPAGGGPKAVAVHPSGRFAYACNEASDSLSSYTIDNATGALSEMTASPATNVQADPVDLVVHPGGRLLFVATRAGFVQYYLINTDPNNAGEDGSIVNFPVDIPITGVPRNLRLNAAGDVLYVALEDSAGTVQSYSVTLTPIIAVTLIDTDAAGASVHSVAVRQAIR